MPAFVLRLAVASAASLLSTSAGQAAPGTIAPAFIPTGNVADAPTGFVDMCARDHTLCLAGHTDAASPGSTVAGTEPHDQVTIAAIATLSPMGTPMAAPAVSAGTSKAPAFTLLRQINGKVNRTVFQAYDLDTAGVVDRWQRPDPNGRRLVGDCEDLAIEKRARLLDAGVAPNRLFFAEAYLPGIGLHAVLIARLDDGDYVLDSRTTEILPWSAVHYNWLRIQSTSDPMVWTRFASGQRPAEVAGSAGGTVAS